MKRYISLSQYPGITGKTYYTYFFKKYGLNCTYEPLACTDIGSSIKSAVESGVSGVSISMPFKGQIIQYLDTFSQDVQDYGSCNTVVVEGGKLHGHNADLVGAKAVVEYIPAESRVAILGNGNMAKIFHRLLGQGRSTIISRSTGNWGARYNRFDVYINCTPYGTSTEESPFSYLPLAVLVVDLALKPNNLNRQCTDSGTKYLPGTLFYRHQFVKQFEIYTGIKPNVGEFDEI